MHEDQISAIQEKLATERKPKRIKRFYKKATLKGKAAPFCVMLDGRPVKTPMRQPLCVTSRAMGRAIVREWNDQEVFIEPETMPVTKYTNTAIDRVEPRRKAIIDEIVAFAASDLICYRAESPAGLVQRQAEIWDPVIEWVKSEYGLAFTTVAGIVYASQPDETLAKTWKLLEQKSSFELVAIHELANLLGSTLLTLALVGGKLTKEQTWAAAHIDEDWNLELWGTDEDTEKRRAARLKEFEGIYRFFLLANKK